MAVKSKVGVSGGKALVLGRPKKTRQGRGVNTSLAATSRNGRKKRYRGQGRG